MSNVPSPSISEASPDLLFEDFFVSQRQSLFTAVYLAIRDRTEAEEVTQDAFVRLLERWDDLGHVQDLEGYLFRVAFNLIRNRRRRSLAAVRRVFDRTERDELSAIEARDTVSRALDRLTPRQRAVLVLVDLSDRTTEETSQLLGIKPSTVRVLLARGRDGLREGVSRDDI
ncbi:MAG: sigma-70 family RNA polymerase sigma factor [Actinomycetota bacterium]